MNPNINPDTIDFNQLREDRKDLDQKILNLKGKLRAPWGNSFMGDYQNQLRIHKTEATELCILRAYLRGRWHLKDQVKCQKIAERILSKKYRIHSQTSSLSDLQMPSMQVR